MKKLSGDGFIQAVEERIAARPERILPEKDRIKCDVCRDAGWVLTERGTKKVLYSQKCFECGYWDHAIEAMKEAARKAELKAASEEARRQQSWFDTKER